MIAFGMRKLWSWALDAIFWGVARNLFNYFLLFLGEFIFRTLFMQKRDFALWASCKRYSKSRSSSNHTYLFSLKHLYSLRLCSFNQIVLAKFTICICAPRIEISFGRHNKSRSIPWNLEVFNNLSLEKLYSMRSIEIAKSTFSPNVKLLVLRKGSRKASCSYFNNFSEINLLEHYGFCLISVLLSNSKLSIFVGSH